MPRTPESPHAQRAVDPEDDDLARDRQDRALLQRADLWHVEDRRLQPHEVEDRRRLRQPLPLIAESRVSR